jgi:hypothetical protein
MIRLESISINHMDYLYKCRRKVCYICNRPVRKYKPLICKCSDPNCELGKKPANIPICRRCLPIWLNSQKNKRIRSRQDRIKDNSKKRRR